ncbi:MAG: hypothetical protein JW759_08950 [Candidatus Coatesbacteria bacterium]|nr:hypothetical protein [Candidatus Coatesbacteria bacterium]
MLTDESERIERIRMWERQKIEQLPEMADGLCPYYRERLAPLNPLSFTTQPRMTLPVGDNRIRAVFSTLAL